MPLDDHLKRLREARAVLVRDRRETADSMILSKTAAASIQAPGFVRLQETIDAIDRAIADEKQILSQIPREGDRPLLPGEKILDGYIVPSDYST